MIIPFTAYTVDNKNHLLFKLLIDDNNFTFITSFNNNIYLNKIKKHEFSFIPKQHKKDINEIKKYILSEDIKPIYKMDDVNYSTRIELVFKNMDDAMIILSSDTQYIYNEIIDKYDEALEEVSELKKDIIDLEKKYENMFNQMIDFKNTLDEFKEIINDVEDDVFNITDNLDENNEKIEKLQNDSNVSKKIINIIKEYLNTKEDEFTDIKHDIDKIKFDIDIFDSRIDRLE